MKVKIEHILPWLHFRAKHYEKRMIDEAEAERKDKLEYESKFISRLFGLKYSGTYQYVWTQSPEQAKKGIKIDIATLEYYVQYLGVDVVDLRDYHGGSYRMAREYILRTYTECVRNNVKFA
jgi:hypothetical protein